MSTDLKLALLFPGQGSQTVGMGRDLYDNFPVAKAVFDEADSALDFPLSKLIFEGPDEDLRRTEHTQPAILTVSIAAWRVLAEALKPLALEPAFAAGHSLGEYSAHVAAGTLGFADALKIVRNRGRYMQEAVPEGEGAMAAILGLDARRVNDLCAEASDEHTAAPLDDVTPSESHLVRANAAASIVSPANLNSLGQTVISGSTAAVHRVIELCKAAGAKRAILLPVSAPFHCQLMQPAQDRLTIDLEGAIFEDPTFPVVSNVDVRAVTRRAEARDCLIRQVTARVRWVETIDLLLNQGMNRFIEVGPGKVLSGLLRQIAKEKGCEAAASNVEDKASLEATVAAVTP